MKRTSILSVALVTALALGLAFSGVLLAQQDSSKVQERAAVQQQYRAGTQGPADGRSDWHGRNFIDENGNGICDRLEQGKAFGPKGKRGMGHGPNFIDENGDGVCDRYAAGGRHMGRGHKGSAGRGFAGMGRGHRAGR